ncbi:hypothetical protein [Streptomyces zaomyceticus]|uniref:hypothetical protein n=1 Tax=Streptomyces zaomyceticus TaxID=68286 RepID=UPI0036992281
MSITTAPFLPWGTRVQRNSDGRLGTVTGHGDRGSLMTWDRAVRPEGRQYARDELTDPDYQVFLPVQHCSDCGHLIDDDEIDDGYTGCCNEGACTCAAVDGIYQCGTEQPAVERYPRDGGAEL